MIHQIIGGIIGIVITIYLLNWWKYRHLFEVDLEKDMPFTAYWFGLSQKERDDEFEKMVMRNKKEWNDIEATMTDDEIENKYCLGTLYISKEARAKRKIEEQTILAARRA